MPEPLPIAIEPFSWSDLNLEQTFRLIEKYIPLKICQDHEIIPLAFRDQCLTLGIVDFQRNSLHGVIKKLLARGNFSLKGRQLDSKTYQLIISSFLNYQQNALKAQTGAAQGESAPKDIPPHERATLVVEEVGNLALPHQHPFSEPIAGGSLSSQAEDDKETKIFEGEVTDFQNPFRLNPDESPSGIFVDTAPAIAVPNAPVKMQRRDANAQRNAQRNYDQLQIHPQYLHVPLENLGQLPAQQLWQELLGRILLEGIGRLYFENHPNEGRILLSESGVMKGALYGLAIDTFHGVLNEYKRLAHLPPVPVDRPKKVEMEQYYNNERILLRLRVMPGKYGEEGTLQVLRGQALHFYQQQQMDELGHEVLEVAQQLERKLRHIYLRSQINPSPLNALNDLYEYCDRFRAQLDNIRGYRR